MCFVGLIIENFGWWMSATPSSNYWSLSSSCIAATNISGLLPSLPLWIELLKPLDGSGADPSAPPIVLGMHHRQRYEIYFRGEQSKKSRFKIPEKFWFRAIFRDFRSRSHGNHFLDFAFCQTF
jgi:hypothetical protein